MLLNINERGKWSNPPPNDPVACAVQDEEIFQTARLVKYVIFPQFETHALCTNLISCGHYMSMFFGDYVAGFLGLDRDGISGSINPFDVRLPDLCVFLSKLCCIAHKNRTRHSSYAW